MVPFRIISYTGATVASCSTICVHTKLELSNTLPWLGVSRSHFIRLPHTAGSPRYSLVPRPTRGTRKRAWWHLAEFLYVLSQQSWFWVGRITFVRYQLLHSNQILYTSGRFTANMSEVIVVPRLELEVNLEDVSAAIEVAVRRLGYVPPPRNRRRLWLRLSKATMFSFPSRPVVASRCAMRAFLGVFDALRSGGEVGCEHPSIVVVVLKSVAVPEWKIRYLCYFQFSRTELRVCRHRTFHILCMPS